MGIITKAAKAFNEINWDKVGIFTGGVLFGTAGIKILSSKDAKKVYTQTAAAAMRAQSCVMKTVTKVRENCDDIVTDAKIINEERAAADEYIEDAPAEEKAEAPAEEAYASIIRNICAVPACVQALLLFLKEVSLLL